MINNYKTLSVITLILILFTSACKKQEEQKPPQIKNIKVLNPVVSSISQNVEYSAKLKPLEEIIVSPKIAGKVETVNFTVGKNVNMGDVLFTLEKKEAEAQYNQTKAAFDSANANLTRTSDFSNSQQILQAEQNVKQCQNQYDDSKKNYDKVVELYSSLQVSKQELDDSETKLKNATLQLETAKSNLDILNTKGAPQSTQVAKAQVAQAEASLKLSSLQIENITIKSPASGVVSICNVDAGELVNSATQAFIIINTNTIIAETNVPYNIVKSIKNGQKLKVLSSDNIFYDGIVDNIAPNADAKTQFYPVKIKIDNQKNKLKTGSFAKVIFEYEKKDNIITVPNESIVYESGVQFIYKVENNIVKKVNISAGISDSTKTEVINNVKVTDNIISEGQSFLSDGEKVNIIN